MSLLYSRATPDNTEVFLYPPVEENMLHALILAPAAPWLCRTVTFFEGFLENSRTHSNQGGSGHVQMDGCLSDGNPVLPMILCMTDASFVLGFGKKTK